MISKTPNQSQYLLIGFCPDLTDPYAESINIAALKIDGNAVGFSALNDAVEIDKELHSQVAQNFDQFVSGLVRRGLDNAERGSLLEWLNSELRHTSFHVSKAGSLSGVLERI
mgnify:CR=1 FL=1